jgi:hypothetical protein
MTAGEALARARELAGRADVPEITDACAPPREEPINEGGGEHHATGAEQAGPPPQPAGGDPAPPAAPHHEPKLCSSCSAPILWAATLDHEGNRIRRDDGKGWKSMPVDFQPSLEGNVQVFHREGEGIVARVFKNAAAAPPGARLRTSHHATCPQGKQWRRRHR